MANQIVLDTNIVLDAFVFSDAATQPLRSALERRELAWIATAAMRQELARVLDYPAIAARRVLAQLSIEAVLGHFDHHVELHPVAPRASLRCTDPDDQMFIDLALAQQCLLLSKDRAVLRLRKRLLGQRVNCAVAFHQLPLPTPHQ